MWRRAAVWDKPRSVIAACKISVSIFAMPETPRLRRGGPPHNPGVRELVTGKRQWSAPLKHEDAKLGFQSWHERGFLPHRDEPGLTQFVTFHLADSFPATLRSEWEAMLQVEDDSERRLQLENYLDQGRGGCLLRQPEIARIIEGAFRFHHAQWYDLLAWVLMPNHVHLLLKVSDSPLSKIVKELKRYTAREANKIIRRKGAFWGEDYFDTYMRDAEHELKTRRYIENNPVKALLVREPREWPWSSARFRDGHGMLRL
jgi:REP element-mobilizing transposase RayT